VLGDIDVGNQVVVASNSLVKCAVADGSMVAGVPSFVVSSTVGIDYVAEVAAHER
jgi:serine acetyltransferase